MYSTTTTPPVPTVSPIARRSVKGTTVRTKGDDLDLLLAHEDFPRLLTLVVQVKKSRLLSPPKSSSPSVLTPHEICKSVERLQQRTTPLSTVMRGMHPITDSLMDDCLVALEKELALQGVPIPPRPLPMINNRKKKKDAIAIKYAKWQTDILMNWMIAHFDQPFPEADDIAQLMTKTGLSQSQVINWTTNVRKRNRKATCEGSKKPHHFIDFLFLKQDRIKTEKRFATPSPMLSSSTPMLPSIDELSDLEPLAIEVEPDEELLQDFSDFWLDEEEATPPILPSVTIDSAASSPKRPRSPDWLSDEEISSWAAELGLEIEV